MKIVQIQFLIEQNSQENRTISKGLQFKNNVPCFLLNFNIFDSDMHGQSPGQTILNRYCIILIKWLLNTLLYCPFVLFHYPRTTLHKNVLFCAVELSLIHEPKHELIKITHHFLHSPQRINNIIEHIILLNWIVQQILSITESKPVNIKVIMLEYIVIECSVELSAIFQCFHGNHPHLVRCHDDDKYSDDVPEEFLTIE